ncbi:6-pyruvoyltetrahydropterin/6-carboxytetrahydropterin synthase [Bacillus mesophilus]|uniref:6-carboxy-5,6,7,8-tetrahydropterin synthase n=1 Tax=Bacillus mesophilus TaxID=1808955 RepID=A0A6M0Q5V5_9BACI|nr:6-carboxytetrahydropterin synthase QueD [Bacillus mesophilus]MBM7659629.1 6-pyruvoyltetrahydropterin/6-carboxytetrahydropterin synthase [Bacillus mesophilus]NEY70498.1 6-carboxytetrahydropterin synthase QueD [Bacillus mesophilus]
MLQQFYPQVQHSYSYELNKDMHFAAAHFIPHEDAGKCRNVHGHTYFVNITVAGDDLNESGFLVNFQDLKKIVHSRYDHTIMNDQLEDFNENNSDQFPTTEVIARTIWENIDRFLTSLPNKPKCLQVLVRETPTSYVVYRPKVSGK